MVGTGSSSQVGSGSKAAVPAQWKEDLGKVLLYDLAGAGQRTSVMP